MASRSDSVVSTELQPPGQQLINLGPYTREDRHVLDTILSPGLHLTLNIESCRNVTTERSLRSLIVEAAVVIVVEEEEDLEGKETYTGGLQGILPLQQGLFISTNSRPVEVMG